MGILELNDLGNPRSINMSSENTTIEEIKVRILALDQKILVIVEKNIPRPISSTIIKKSVVPTLNESLLRLIKKR
ncbi:MAG: hypothetical protein J7K59_07375 [Candidatus Korarchaeota archaeon]|nr:hypothetical protein [Candidatus Korarchaeota archaeon]